MDSEVVQKHRFHDFGPAEEAAVVDGAIPKNTKKANCFWINVFDTFCREKKIRFDFEKCSTEELGQVLKRFYGGLRKKNGDVYQPGGYLAARAAIQRRLNALKRPFNVREDAAFRESNIVLDAVLKRNKAEGKTQKVQHKDALTDADKDRLAMYFEDVLETQDTRKLQSYCWYNIARHLGLRGSEIFVRIRKDDIEIKTNEDGSEYVTFKGDFLTKNSPGGINGREFASCGRIENATQVKAMRRLLSFLNPNQPRLFQRILYGCRPNDGPWFANAPLGHNSISEMMPQLSVWADLSKRYTNHCVRATVVTDLMDAGFSAHEVCAVTGHKNAQSLEHYDRIDREGSARPSEMVKVLDGEILLEKNGRKAKLASATICEPRAPSLASSTLVREEMLAGHVVDKIVIRDQSVVHHLTINIGTTTEKQQQQSVSSSQHL